MQSAASSLPGTSTYLPAMQSMQSDASSLPHTSMYLPTTQSMQSEASSLPVTSIYLPAMQSMQRTMIAWQKHHRDVFVQELWSVTQKKARTNMIVKQSERMV